MVRNYIRKTISRWSEEGLLAALKELKAKTRPVAEILEQYQIPRATLYRYLRRERSCSESIMTGSGGGSGGGGGIRRRLKKQMTLLSPVEEEVLAEIIVKLRANQIVGPREVKEICFQYLEREGRPNKFNKKLKRAGNDWYYGFCKRNPIVQLPYEVLLLKQMTRMLQWKIEAFKKIKNGSAEKHEERNGSANDRSNDAEGDLDEFLRRQEGEIMDLEISTGDCIVLMNKIDIELGNDNRKEIVISSLV